MPLSVRRLSKEFFSRAAGGSSLWALRDVTFDVSEGECVVILGEAGSGKSTLLKIIVNLLAPSAGEVILFGLASSDWAWKEEVGYLPQWFRPSSTFTGRTYLTHVGKFHGMLRDRLAGRVSTLLELLGLDGADGVQLKHYSQSMMIRLGLAQALINTPRLLLLDEPFKGLLRGEQALVGSLLTDFCFSGGSVFICSEELSGVAKAANQLMLIEKGSIQAPCLPPAAHQHRYPNASIHSRGQTQKLHVL